VNARVTPLATAVDRSNWPLVLADSFDTNVNGWTPQDRVNNNFVSGERLFAKGKYHWNVTARQSASWADWMSIAPVSDLYASVEARQVSGPSQDASYGLVFRVVDDGNYYRFIVDDNRYFSVGVLHRGRWMILIDRTRSDVVKPGQVNRLAVTAQGSQFAFYINDQHVGAVRDNRIAAGRAGLTIDIARAGVTAGVEFDNFELRTSFEAATRATAQVRQATVTGTPTRTLTAQTPRPTATRSPAGGLPTATPAPTQEPYRGPLRLQAQLVGVEVAGEGQCYLAFNLSATGGTGFYSYYRDKDVEDPEFKIVDRHPGGYTYRWLRPNGWGGPVSFIVWSGVVRPQRAEVKVWVDKSQVQCG
jgi:hypothetical protein